MTVRFSVASKGNDAGATFTGGVPNDLGTLNTAPLATTDAAGRAEAPDLTANTVAGAYTATATLLDARGVAIKSVTFTLTNTTGPLNIVVDSGNGQSTLVGTQFAKPLTVKVTDRSGNPVAYWPVSFSAPIVPSPGLPGPAPTAQFVADKTPGAKNSSAITVYTKKDGTASSPLVKANDTAGVYNIKAQVSVPLPPSYMISVLFSTNFKMTNKPAPPAKFEKVLPTNDVTVSNETFYATTGKNFSSLVVKVTDKNGMPVSGVTVEFKTQSPNGEPGGTFGCNSAKIYSRPTTGVDGLATADVLCANGTKGGFPVTATVLGTNLSTEFSLWNKGQVVIPYVVGKTLAQAVKAITDELLNVTLAPAQPSNTIPAGNVISQSPKADVNKPVDVGTTVTITVSSGK
jgi:hypothetical protein